MNERKKRISLLGGGPSALFAFKSLLETGRKDIFIIIFESGDELGKGFPYSLSGAAKEHITNVSSNEIPELSESLKDWVIAQDDELLHLYGIDRSSFHQYETVPRLLFGHYLSAQFNKLVAQAKENKIDFSIHTKSLVTDVIPDGENFLVEIAGDVKHEVDTVIMCTGHHWPRRCEEKIPGWFDSPYPPSKLKQVFNHTVAISGGSLTAIDAVRTIAGQHGHFKNKGLNTQYVLNEGAGNFKIVLHSIEGLFPAVRFHLDNSHLDNPYLLSKEELDCHMKENDGFLSLDFIFEHDFKLPIQKKDTGFYELIKDMALEEFVAHIMTYRENTDPFILLEKEYTEAAQSIRLRKSVYWKEMLGVLSFAMNYPAKHFSAEDMLRLQKVLMPLISVVIAYTPQSSCEELIALHKAGILEMIAADKNSKATPLKTGGAFLEGKEYKTYINCIGQPHLSYEDFPFTSAVQSGIVSQAKIKYRFAKQDNDDLFLQVPGIAINDNFQAIDQKGNATKNFYVMAVPYIGGHNPDYSGLDFCAEASAIITDNIFK